MLKANKELNPMREPPPLKQKNKLNVAAPRASSTTLILRDRKTYSGHFPREERIVEVLLLKRSAQSRLLPNALVFPGGAVELDDDQRAFISLGSERLSNSLRLWKEWGFQNEKQAQNSLGAALRETKEECSLELAELARGELSMQCIAHWLTPSVFKKRFDAYFWGVALPTNLNPALQVDQVEISEAQWWTPQEALKSYDIGAIELPVPTLMTLIELAENIEQERVKDLSRTEPSFSKRLIDRLASEPYPHPIQPIMSRHHEIRLLFPGDQDYAQAKQHGERDESPQRPFWSRGRHHLIQEEIILSPTSPRQSNINKRWKRVRQIGVGLS